MSQALPASTCTFGAVGTAVSRAVSLQGVMFEPRPLRLVSRLTRPSGLPPQDVLFEPDSLRLVSRHHNLIAFTLDVGLLLKVGRRSHADGCMPRGRPGSSPAPGNADEARGPGRVGSRRRRCHRLPLGGQHPPPARMPTAGAAQRHRQPRRFCGGKAGAEGGGCAGRGQPPAALPLLLRAGEAALARLPAPPPRAARRSRRRPGTHHHRAYQACPAAQDLAATPGPRCRRPPVQAEGCSLGQDLPISSPYGAAEIDHLVRTSSSSEDLCGWYLDVGCVRHRLQPVVDKMRGISSQLKLVLCKVMMGAGAWRARAAWCRGMRAGVLCGGQGEGCCCVLMREIRARMWRRTGCRQGCGGRVVPSTCQPAAHAPAEALQPASLPPPTAEWGRAPASFLHQRAAGVPVPGLECPAGRWVVVIHGRCVSPRHGAAGRAGPCHRRAACWLGSATRLLLRPHAEAPTLKPGAFMRSRHMAPAVCLQISGWRCLRSSGAPLPRSSCKPSWTATRAWQW